MKTIIALLVVALILTSCARGITTYDAANGRAKCGKHQYIK